MFSRIFNEVFLPKKELALLDEKFDPSKTMKQKFDLKRAHYQSPVTQVAAFFGLPTHFRAKKTATPIMNLVKNIFSWNDLVAKKNIGTFVRNMVFAVPALLLNLAVAVIKTPINVAKLFFVFIPKVVKQKSTKKPAPIAPPEIVDPKVVISTHENDKLQDEVKPKIGTTQEISNRFAAETNTILKQAEPTAVLEDAPNAANPKVIDERIPSSVRNKISGITYSEYIHILKKIEQYENPLIKKLNQGFDDGYPLESSDLAIKMIKVKNLLDDEKQATQEKLQKDVLDKKVNYINSVDAITSSPTPSRKK